jgi:phenylalanyl-tRNA synthetase beta chain
MKISYSWLARHVDLSGVSAKEAAAELTLSTAEVEGVEAFLPHLSDVTVGHVVHREKHPDADKLSLCKVDIGAGEPLQIVCGAPNVRAGLKVAVATSGVTLPGDFKIKKSKIRGVESNGMICSERELGLGDEHNGIWELPLELRVGENVAAALGALDWVIEIDNKSITHRPDLWGHRGVARELAAILRRPLKPLEAQVLPWNASPKGEVPVRIDTPNCPRYLALAIDGARAEKSPFWLKRLLLSVGQRPIDLLVDLSNFVMLDLGQPNHLFDRRRLSSEGIVVRMARANESLKTLDGVERKLEPSDMLICSGDAPVALAGVMGGETSKVEGDTSQLVLEVATFHPTVVRRTSTRLGLRTDSSARFEKNLDPELPPLAARHFVALLQAEQPDVRAIGTPTDVGAWKSTARRVPMRFERVRALLGAELGDAQIRDILERLEFGIESEQNGACVVLVPSYRGTKDITLEQDLVEEVGRIHRYGNIPERVLEGALTPPPRDEAWKRRMLVRRVEDRLALAAHFHQLVSYSFVHDGLLEKLGEAATPHCTVQNSIAEGYSRVRRSVVPSVLAVLETNRRRRADVRLFEVGKGYVPSNGSEPVEVHEVALALSSTPAQKDARFDDNSAARLKGVVEDVVRSLGLEAGAWSKCESAPSWANPGRSAQLRIGDVPVGELATLEPGLARALGLAGELESDTALARLSIDALLGAAQRTKLYQPIPQFPETLVDVALALPEERPAAEAAAAIERCGKGLVGSLELFDLYRGPNVGEGRKSLAWHVVLRASDRTLTDQDVKKFLERVEREATALGGVLRRE